MYGDFMDSYCEGRGRVWKLDDRMTTILKRCTLFDTRYEYIHALRSLWSIQIVVTDSS